jgi:hypothetical protein
VAGLVRHLPGQQNPFDVVVATAHAADAPPVEAEVSLVTPTVDKTASAHPHLIVDDVVRDDHILRHDPDKLASVLMRVYDAERRTRSTNGTVRAAH